MQGTFEEHLNNRKEEMDKLLRQYMPTAKGYASPVLEAMDYAVEAGGKRIRPILLVETYEMFANLSLAKVNEEEEVLKAMQAGDPNRDAQAMKVQSLIPCDVSVVTALALAVEMVHTYSLIHDDLPAMDNDDLRRGKPTVHKKFGEDVAILAGDGLLNYAYEMAFSPCEHIRVDSFTNMIHFHRVVTAARFLMQKAGILGMVGGQTADVTLTGKPVTEDALAYIYENKTCALLEASMMIGAILGAATEDQLEKVGEAAKALGMAFQIQDDILDIEGDEATLGKPLHSDEEQGKTTYVSLHGMDGAKADVKKYSDRAVEIMDSFGGNAEFLKDLILSLVDRKN